MRIIPAIDILGGKCVRLTMGSYDSVKTYDSNPPDVARRFEDYGFRYLHVVDLDGAKEKHVVNYRVLENICRETSLIIDFGGGVKSEEDISIVFSSGASAATIGSVAVTDRELFLRWLETYSEKRIILGADFKERKVVTSGWTENSEVDVLSFITGYVKTGVSYVTCTDVSRDGMLSGPSVDLYREILANTRVNLIASGGITTISDVKLLAEAGCEGAIIGKAIYEGRIDIRELSELC
jgi:phosphoribosylformimino-5-aminoimidazole carboxamide ribotide isomerase